MSASGASVVGGQALQIPNFKALNFQALNSKLRVNLLRKTIENATSGKSLPTPP